MTPRTDYTHYTFIGHKNLFQFVANYGQSKALAVNQILQSGCPLDNYYFFS